MSTQVLLLRHAESADPNVFHGAESDVDLSERGRRQAQLIAAALAQLQPHAVVSSAMRRAKGTAQAIAQACRVPLFLEPDLHERRVADLCGERIDRHQETWNRTVEQWTRGQTGFAHAGAESFDDIQRRVLPIWTRVTSAWAGQTLVIVAHGIVCKVLLLSVLGGLSSADWRGLGSLRNVGVSALEGADAAWQANYLNWWPEGMDQV